MNHTCIRMLYSLPVMSTDATPWKVAHVVYHLLKDFTVRQSAFGLLSRNVEKGAGLKQTILKRLELVTSMNYHLLLSKGTWYFKEASKPTVLTSSSHWSARRPGVAGFGRNDVRAPGLKLHVSWFVTQMISCSQSCVEALLIESGFSLP